MSPPWWASLHQMATSVVKMFCHAILPGGAMTATYNTVLGRNARVGIMKWS